MESVYNLLKCRICLQPTDLGIRLKAHPDEIVLEFPRKAMAAIVEVK